MPGRTAPRSGFALPDSSPSAIPRSPSPFTDTRPPASSQLILRSIQDAARKREHFLPHRHRGRMARASGNHGASACERAGPPVELARVSRDDLDVFDVDAQRIRDQLREDSEVPLPLRADTGRAPHLPAGFDGDARPFVRADAGAFDIAGDADADVPALGAQPRLFFAHESLVADRLARPARASAGSRRCRRSAAQNPGT